MDSPKKGTWWYDGMTTGMQLRDEGPRAPSLDNLRVLNARPPVMTLLPAIDAVLTQYIRYNSILNRFKLTVRAAG